MKRRRLERSCGLMRPGSSDSWNAPMAVRSFHRNSVLDGGFSRLTVGARVAFAEEMGENGPQASTVRPLGKHGLRA